MQIPPRVLRVTHLLAVAIFLSGLPLAANGAAVPKATEAEALRFLRQATFGPNKALVSQIQKSGIDAFLNQQLKMKAKKYPNMKFYPESRPAQCTETCARDNYTYYLLQRHFFNNALTGRDQLRQRVAFALSQILVTSGRDIPLPAWMRVYQQMLYDNAFGNYRQILYEVTLSPTMGRYLNMLDNRCQTRVPSDPNVCRNGLGSQPNENYAREILQLFSIGTFMLNQDGTYQVDVQGKPIATYDQEMVEEFARVFTGWTLAPPLRGIGGDVPNYKNRMVVRLDSQGRESWHDRGAKTLLNNFQIPAGTSAESEINMAMDNIISHPNVAPFLSKQLIRHLVTSNPTPAYVGRVAAVFTSNVNAPNQLELVVRAILMDPEARTVPESATDPDYGKLNEPVIFMTNFLRAFDVKSDGVINSYAAGVAQDILRAPTVFNYYPAEYEVPGEENLIGPAFGIYSSQTSVLRANFVNRVLFGGIQPSNPDRPKGTFIDLKTWEALAADPAGLVSRLNCWLLGCSMSQAMQTAVVNAVLTVPVTNPTLRAQTAIYVITTSAHYQVLR